MARPIHPNGGRRPLYIERARVAVINKSWDFLEKQLERAEKLKDEQRQMEIVKILIPIMSKMTPQENINKNENTTTIILSEEDRAMIKEMSAGFSESLRQKQC